MKLYNKNLTSLEALRREKAALKFDADTSLQNILSLDLLDKSAGSHISPVHTTIDFLTSKDFASKLMALSVPLLKIAGSKLEKSLLKKVVKEVFSGYLKWKAFEIGFNVVKDRFSKES